MVAKTERNKVIHRPYHEDSHTLKMVNKDCWGSSFTDDIINSVDTFPFKETEWEVESIEQREEANNRVRYLLHWKPKNGRFFSK